MNPEKYLEHVGQYRQSMAAHLATFALAGAATAFGKHIATGEQNIPKDGPVILAANHVSYADTILLNAYFYLFQRIPNILAKDNLFKPPIIGSYMRAIHALPVARGQGAANQPVLDTALQVLDRGDAVMIYPEGSAGRGEDLWPIKGKSGLGYLALKSSAPVVPVAQWGAQDIVWRGDDGKQHASLWPLRKPIDIAIGEPLIFSETSSETDTATGKRLGLEQRITDVVMHKITQQLAEIRSEEPKGYYSKERGDVTSVPIRSTEDM